jgi:glutathione peroxidase
MRNALLIFATIFLSFTSYANHHEVYDYNVKLTSGDELKLSDFKGKAFMIVNIATRCGYTGQLDDLEKLFQKFKGKGFSIVGIPSNDFGGQTPEGNKEVADFCRLKYGATFPITNKAIVKGAKKSELMKHLIQDGDEIAWNFEKFLIGKSGKVIGRFKSGVEPLSKNLVQAIEGALK